MNHGRYDMKGMNTARNDDPRAIPVRRYLPAPRQDVVNDRVGTIDDERNATPDQGCFDQRFDRIPGECRLSERVEHRREDARAIGDEIGRYSDHLVGRELAQDSGHECRLADPARADDDNPTRCVEMVERCRQDLVNMWI